VRKWINEVEHTDKFILIHYNFFTAKSGVDPSQASEVVRTILEECPTLKFCGLMTIGKLDGDPREDFQVRLFIFFYSYL